MNTVYSTHWRTILEQYFRIVERLLNHLGRRVKMMDIAKTSIMLAFYAASVNFRLIDAFDREQQRATERAANGHVVSRRQPRRHRAVSIQYQLNQTSGTDPPKQPATSTV